MKKLLLLFLLCGFLFSSCLKEKIIEMPPSNSTMIIGFVEPYKPLQLTVARGLSLYDNLDSIKPIAGVVIVLYKNDIAEDTLIFDSGYYKTINPIEPNNKYTIKGINPLNNITFEASTFVPDALAIIADTLDFTDTIVFQDLLVNVKLLRSYVSIPDPASTDFYIVQMTKFDSIDDKSNPRLNAVNLNTKDLSNRKLNDEQQLLLLNDLSFNNSTKVFEYFYPPWIFQNGTTNGVPNWSGTRYIDLTVRRSSLDYYNYVNSALEQQIQLANPLGEIISVYSNIKGGIGIFAGYSEKTTRVYEY